MRIRLRETLRNSKLVVLTLMLCSILIVSAYAIFYLWSASATVTISASSPYIKVYCGGEEVTSLNLGTLVPGTQVRIRLVIRNTHPNATITEIHWDSTVSSVTDKITDNWAIPYGWPTSITPNSERSSEYYVTIASDCPLGTYSWTLYLHGPA